MNIIVYYKCLRVIVRGLKWKLKILMIVRRVILVEID